MIKTLQAQVSVPAIGNIMVINPSGFDKISISDNLEVSRSLDNFNTNNGGKIEKESFYPRRIPRRFS